MPLLHLAASMLTSAFLVVLCLVLAGPAFELASFGPRGGLQAGTLPQFVVVSVIALAALSMLDDLRRWYAGRRAPTEADPAVAPPGQVAVLGGGIVILLAAYVFLWRHLPFPVITTGFMALASCLIAPARVRTPRGYIGIGAMAVLFSLGVWLVFTYALKVPLR